MPRTTYTEQTFSNSFKDCAIEGNFEKCDFSQVNMTRVELNGTFTDCNFEPQEGVTRCLNEWDRGTFIRCKGVGH
jgi:uncharacterized protein YjbI with pentapeptide repeats